MADAGAPGGLRVSEGRGSLDVGGTLTIHGPVSMPVGTTGGGIADGSVRINPLGISAQQMQCSSAPPMSMVRRAG